MAVKMARVGIEARRSEDALRESEDGLRIVIDTIPAMAWSVLPDGAVDFLNQRWLDYTGLSLEQYLEEPMRPMHPEDSPRALEKWFAVMAAGKPYKDEMRLRRADGEYRWFLIRVVPLRDERGNIIKWYGTSTDIEDRKRAEDALRRSEDRLRHVVDTIPAIVWSALPDGAVDFVNDRWLQYTGLSREDSLGWRWTATIHPAASSADRLALRGPRVAAAVERQSVGMVAPCRLSDRPGALRCAAVFPGHKARRPIASSLCSAS